MEASGDNRFGKQLRLLARSDFLRVSASQNKIAVKGFLAIWLDTGNQHPRLGITASRKTGNAVTRNRIKRHVREFFRVMHSTLPAVDINVIARSDAAAMDFDQIRKSLERAFEELRRKT